MQTINLTGRCGQNAETREAGSGNVTSFSLAVDQGWGDSKTTNWYRISIWGERGTKLRQYIRKGDKVAVTGELTIGEYQGKPQYEVRANDVDCFMTPKQDTGGTTDAVRRPEPAFGGDDDSDVPF